MMSDQSRLTARPSHNVNLAGREYNTLGLGGGLQDVMALEAGGGVMEDHGRLGRETQTTINLDGYTTTNNTQTIHDNILLSPSNLVPDIMQKQQQQQGGQHGTSFPAGGPSRHRQEAEHG
jgi:hypothetical protein